MKPLYIDHSDGKGPQRMPDATLDDFKASWISNIKAQLIEIDQKSIRPAREGEPEYLASLTEQAVAYRSKILQVNSCLTIEEVEAIEV